MTSVKENPRAILKAAPCGPIHAPRPRQPPMDPISCGIQSAYISLINRRELFSLPISFPGGWKEEMHANSSWRRSQHIRITGPQTLFLTWCSVSAIMFLLRVVLLSVRAMWKIWFTNRGFFTASFWKIRRAQFIIISINWTNTNALIYKT